ncbi:MAG TPA: response regulator [Magnetospirillaceae bacterium]|jgi:DNA-binding response OmpR family regulator
MPVQRIDNVHVAIGDPNQQLRSTFRRALKEAGASEVSEAGNLEGVVKLLDNIAIDLFMVDADMEGNFCEIAQKIRNQALGKNPFVAVIAMTGIAEARSIQKILGSGVDDLLIKPVSLDVVIDRIRNLIDARKPFVVTHNYIGPDRRGVAARTEKNPLVPVEVPNTLRAKATGSTEDVQKMIVDAVSLLNGKKMERYSVEIGYLVKRVEMSQKSHKSIYEIRGDLERMKFVGRDLQRRMAGTAAEHAAYLAGSLVTVAERAAKSHDGPVPRDVELLVQLSAAIRHAFGSDESTVEAAMEITETIAKFADKT